MSGYDDDGVTLAYRCPRPACVGLALDTWGPGHPPYRCDLCDVAWTSRAALEAEIDAIVKRYPHRAAVYVRVEEPAGHWVPVADADVPLEYEDEVEAER